jgi:hypothetical protein
MITFGTFGFDEVMQFEARFPFTCGTAVKQGVTGELGGVLMFGHAFTGTAGRRLVIDDPTTGPHQIDDAVERRDAGTETAFDLHLDTLGTFVRGDGALGEVGLEHGPGLCRAGFIVGGFPGDELGGTVTLPAFDQSGVKLLGRKRFALPFGPVPEAQTSWI